MMTKRYFLTISLALVHAFVNAQTKADTLTNEGVLKLINAGLPSELIVTKIRSSITNFDVTMDDLMKLSSSGVPAEVMQAMIDPKAKTTNGAEAINDSISICKKWKTGLTHKNGVPLPDSNTETVVQYNADGTWHTHHTNFNSNQTSDFGGTYVLSDDKKSITTYYQKGGEPQTSEIVKLTNSELETRSTRNGNEYINLLTSIGE